jgi:hypothetical protein
MVLCFCLRFFRCPVVRLRKVHRGPSSPRARRARCLTGVGCNRLAGRAFRYGRLCRSSIPRWTAALLNDRLFDAGRLSVFSLRLRHAVCMGANSPVRMGRIAIRPYICYPVDTLYIRSTYALPIL